MQGDWEGEVKSKYEAGRNGYHILTYFQCNTFRLRNIKGSSPEVFTLKDKTLMITICKALLDKCSNWDPGTIQRNMSLLRKMIGVSISDLGTEE